MASTAAPSPESQPSVSSIGRIFGALFNPKATFESIVTRPTWLPPLVLVCLVSVVVTAAFSRRVGWRSFIEKQVESNPRAQKQMEQLSPAQREQVLDQQAKLAPIFGYGFALVGTFVVAVIIAAIFLAVFNLLSGATIDFKTSLGIVAHAWMPLVVSGLLGILVIFLRDPSTVDIQNLVAANPGAFLSDDSPKWLTTLLSSLDLFSFWVIFLLAMGYRATNPKKISFSKALGSVVGVWLIYVLVRTGLAAAFS